MLDKLFGGDRYAAQTHSLEAASLRHQVISNNLANAETPNYKRQDVRFEEELAKALDHETVGSRKTGFGSIRPAVVKVGGTSTRLDGNNVNMELEAAHLAENTLKYEVMTQSLSGYYSGLKGVINGGR